MIKPQRRRPPGGQKRAPEPEEGYTVPLDALVTTATRPQILAIYVGSPLKVLSSSRHTFTRATRLGV